MRNLVCLLLLLSCSPGISTDKPVTDTEIKNLEAEIAGKSPKISAEPRLWKSLLTPDVFEILNKGTERPFTGKLLKEKRRVFMFPLPVNNRFFILMISLTREQAGQVSQSQSMTRPCWK